MTKSRGMNMDQQVIRGYRPPAVHSLEISELQNHPLYNKREARQMQPPSQFSLPQQYADFQNKSQVSQNISHTNLRESQYLCKTRHEESQAKQLHRPFHQFQTNDSDYFYNGADSSDSTVPSSDDGSENYYNSQQMPKQSRAQPFHLQTADSRLVDGLFKPHESQQLPKQIGKSTSQQQPPVPHHLDVRQQHWRQEDSHQCPRISGQQSSAQRLITKHKDHHRETQADNKIYSKNHLPHKNIDSGFQNLRLKQPLNSKRVLGPKTSEKKDLLHWSFTENNKDNSSLLESASTVEIENLVPEQYCFEDFQSSSDSESDVKSSHGRRVSIWTSQRSEHNGKARDGFVLNKTSKLEERRNLHRANKFSSSTESTLSNSKRPSSEIALINIPASVHTKGNLFSTQRVSGVLRNLPKESNGIPRGNLSLRPVEDVYETHTDPESVYSDVYANISTNGYSDISSSFSNDRQCIQTNGGSRNNSLKQSLPEQFQISRRNRQQLSSGITTGNSSVVTAPFGKRHGYNGIDSDDNNSSEVGLRLRNMTFEGAPDDTGDDIYDNESDIYESINPPSFSDEDSGNDHNNRSNSREDVSSCLSNSVTGLFSRDRIHEYGLQNGADDVSEEESTVPSSDDDYCEVVIGQSKKELHRAKTMPVISVSSVLSAEELLQHGVTLNTSGSSASSASVTSSASPRARKVLMRKMSSPESYFGCVRQFGAILEPSIAEKQPETKTKKLTRARSQSEQRLWKTRRRSESKQGSAWSFEDDRRSSGSSYEARIDDNRQTSQLFYTSPPKANMVRSASNEKRLETSSSSGNLQKLSRRLVLRDRKDPLSPSRNRSISLDWGDARAVRLFSSSSEDSPMDVMTGLPASPSAPAYLSNKDGEPNYSPKVMRDLRLLSNSQKKKSFSIDVPDGQQLSGKRKSDKEKRGLFDIGGLFDAVEQQDLDLVKIILESNSVNVNSLNGENLSVLDIAVMTNNIPMAKMLLSKGAKESPIFQKGDCRLQRLESLVTEAEKRVIDLTAVVLNGSSGNANISPAQLRENEKQLSHWEFRHRLLKRMKAGYDHARPPEPPTNVRLEVASNSSLLVNFSEPQSHNGAVVTRYKVEWSSYENFMPLSGEAIVEDLSRLEFEIRNLVRGSQYYVRVCAWNVKGYGSYSNSEPPFAVPSSWREVDGIPSRLEGKVASLHTLYHQVKRSRPPEAGEMKDILNKGADSPMQKKRISIKNLFVSAPKFTKTIKRGVYMACLLYNEDRILVTSEEQLPIIEVDETFSAPSIQNDLYWLLKVSCMWEEVKVLKQDMEKTSSAGSTFRCKLLQAIISLQSGLGIQDLGHFFHRPVRDNNSSIIFTVVNHIRDPKLVTLGSSKWVTFGKLARRQSLSTVDSADAHSLLVSSVPEMILYHQVSGSTLARGLYLGYVKLQASVEVLRVMVPNKTPNSVPHVKIRDCPNVSREEWEWLLKSDSNKLSGHMSNAQQNFQQLLGDATKKLFSQLDLSEDNYSSHRIYDLEVLELSPAVTMILVLPSMEDICIVPGHSDSLAKRADYSFLPVQIFESIHMHAYLPEFFSLYARLSAIVEMDGVLAQQGHREAFSTEELSKAKEQVEVTAHLQQNLDRIWKCARWIRDITTYARNREKKAGIHLSHIFTNSVTNNNCLGTLTNEGKIKPSRTSLGTLNNNNHISNSSTSCSQSNKPNSISVGRDLRRIAKFYDPNEENPHSADSISIGGTPISPRDQEQRKIKPSISVPSTPSQNPHSHPRVSPSSSLSSLSTSASSSTASTDPTPSPDSAYAIIKVHAMYETGLNRNVNIKLHITEQTTSRDIVNLVVRHLNSVIQNKGKGVFAYSEEALENFCLVLKFQGHEKILKDDYKLLQLKGQLQRAKICVTMVNTLFSEEELGQATVV